MGGRTSYGAGRDHLTAQDSVDTDGYVDIDKACKGIWFLLDAAKASIDVVAGGAPVTDEDLGYGPARYLTSGDVELAASYLQAMPWEELAGYFDPAQMTADGIYPAIWDLLTRSYFGLTEPRGVTAAQRTE